MDLVLDNSVECNNIVSGIPLVFYHIRRGDVCVCVCVIVDILYLCVCIRLSMSYKSLCDQVITTTGRYY